MQLKKLHYLLRYVFDQNKTQETCERVVLENGGTSKSVSYWYKNQWMSNKAFENYSHTLEFVPECYNTQKCVIRLSILILLQ